ncbi:MAG TPA: multiheme c-type cytochrome [Vicinamibacterales bacterium]|nr:multiheme c-type cytochrome [Vicinamibacterales bacterium]
MTCRRVAWPAIFVIAFLFGGILSRENPTAPAFAQDASAFAQGATADRTAGKQSPAAGSYTGPGSCAASSCHGSVRPVAGSRILQTEYTTWVVQDKHAQATEVLNNAVSLRMAKILGIGRPDTEQKCLTCHAVDAPAQQRARSYTAEGVSCEACHGPASGWLGPHTTRGWTHAQSVAAGMYDTKDLVRRTEKCASCHIGGGDKSVDHEMIAAGHPDLVFDLEAFSAAMPRHWRTEDPWQNVRSWSVGQIVQLREGLERLAQRSKSGVWPEYAELDCFSCHHSLTRAENSWRQELGYTNRRPGNPPWNHARYAIARHVARVADPGAADSLDSQIQSLAGEASKLQTDRARLAGSTVALQNSLDALARRLASAPVDRARTIQYVRAIAEDAERIAGGGERSAEQAAMSLETLLGTLTQNKEVDQAAARAALDRLFQQLENPSGYDPRRFAPLLRNVTSVLR